MLLRSSDRDVTKPPFFFEIIFAGRRPRVWKQAVFHTDDEHDRKLQPLRRVHRHQRHAIVGLQNEYAQSRRMPNISTWRKAVAKIGYLGDLENRYLNGFWLYRGFRPPRDPAYVRIHGTTQMISVESPALGGRRQLCAEPLLRAASARFAAFGSGARLARTF